MAGHVASSTAGTGTGDGVGAGVTMLFQPNRSPPPESEAFSRDMPAWIDWLCNLTGDGCSTVKPGLVEVVARRRGLPTFLCCPAVHSTPRSVHLAHLGSFRFRR
jgi:hypothetical protein